MREGTVQWPVKEGGRAAHDIGSQAGVVSWTKERVPKIGRSDVPLSCFDVLVGKEEPPCVRRVGGRKL